MRLSVDVIQEALQATVRDTVSLEFESTVSHIDVLRLAELGHKGRQHDVGAGPEKNTN